MRKREMPLQNIRRERERERERERKRERECTCACERTGWVKIFFPLL
jgi:hypothetical protein